jgi:hypothetical protein
MSITINGTLYVASDDPVSWEDAIVAGGFYYERAQYLGLPPPTAILFDDEDPRYLAAMGRYHARFKAAEERGATIWDAT